MYTKEETERLQEYVASGEYAKDLFGNLEEVFWWDRWWAMQSPAAQKMIDDAFKRKVKEYCDESND